MTLNEDELAKFWHKNFCECKSDDCPVAPFRRYERTTSETCDKCGNTTEEVETLSFIDFINLYLEQAK